jgi:hypothetical protein
MVYILSILPIHVCIGFNIDVQDTQDGLYPVYPAYPCLHRV